MPQFFKTKTFRTLACVVVFIVLYAIVGFLVAPRLVRAALLKDIPANLSGVTPAVGDIRINPFLLQVTVDKFSLSGKGGEKLLGFERLFVDFELSSIWHRAYSFGNIDIDSPYVSALVAPDGALNLLELRPKPSSPKATEKEDQKGEELPAVRVGSFKVGNGLLTYEDRSRPDVFAARLEPINFELREFTTGAAGGKFTFTGASKLGERVEWHGHVSVDPIESDGEFQVDGLLAHTLWSYLEDRLNFVVNTGKIDLASTYKFSLQDATANSAAHANLQLDVSKVTLTDFSVRPKDSETDWVTVPALMVTGTHVDLARREARVEHVALTGLKLETWLEADGSVNLMKLAAAPGAPAATLPASAPTVTTTSGTPASGAPPAAAPSWHFDLQQFELLDASIAAEDRTASPAVKVVLAPLSLRVAGASQDLSKPVNIALDTHINDKGVLKVDGLVTPQPAVADLNVKLSDVDLTTIQPYIAQHGSMTLLAGRLGGDLKFHYGGEKQRPSVQVAGDIDVDALHTVDNTLQADFINWDHLDIHGLNFLKNPNRLDIDTITARKLYARVIIESDESINVKRVLAIPKVSGAPATLPARTSTSTTISPAAPSMPMSIKKIVLQASQANFADYSVMPNFSTGIQKLQGTVTGLSSNADSRAQVNLQGAVDTFSPVSIIGTVNVLGPKLFTDMTLKFSNISLPLFNPYSGKFAGYNITEGKLTTEFHYKVDGRALDATHHIVVDQLEFGAKTDSKDAVSVPIKLAISLLKDRNGVIDLDIPVSGTLDDPKFKIGSVIWEVFTHILEKAVTAPFALLGSLLGAGPDIQFIDFKPGVSSLDPTAADKVKTVAKALLERPQLKIEVPIAVVPDVDGPALIAQQFNSQVSDLQASRQSHKAGAAAPVPYAQMPAGTQLDVLTSLYVKDLGIDVKYPDEISVVKSKPDQAAAKIKFLDHAIREHIVVGDAELQALGQQRAVALQTVLLADTQVPPERVFLVANDKASVKDGFVRLELSLR